LITRLIEATNTPDDHMGMVNWGRFLVGRLDREWATPSQVAAGTPVLLHCGWRTSAIFVMDLVTGEGATFTPPGSAHHDLNQHAIWVCPLFEPFLEWLYQQDLTDLEALPAHVNLPEAPGGLHGYRRQGKP
jgi:hypothetical protein